MLNLTALFDPNSNLDRDAALAELPVHERRVLTWALELKQMAPSHDLDLSHYSADALDIIVDAALEGGFASPAHLIRAVACYFEVLIAHHLGAQYVDIGPIPMFMRLIMPSEEAGLFYTSPMRLAIDAWEKRRPRFGEAFEGLVAMMEDVFDKPLFVPFYEPDDLDPVLEPVWLFAQSLQGVLGRFEGGQWNLHTMPPNLRFVDEFMTREPDADMALRLATLCDKPLELRWWRARACAAFFGEMVREHLGGRWIGPQRGPVELVVDGQAFSPLALCEQALDQQRGNYALLAAYQGLMDFSAQGGDFPLADLAPEPPLHNGLQHLPSGRLPALNDDDDDAPSTRQYDSAELAQQFQGGATDFVEAPEKEEVVLSTRQYNSDELQRELIEEMRTQAGSKEAFERQIASSNPMTQRYLTGEGPILVPTTSNPLDADDDADLDIEIDLDQEAFSTRNYDSERLLDGLEGTLDVADTVESIKKPRLDLPGEALAREVESSGPRSMPPGRHIQTVPMSPVDAARHIEMAKAQGPLMPTRHPKTVPMSPIDASNPLHTIATVQGDIPAELVQMMGRGGDQERSRAPSTERLTEVTAGDQDNPHYQQSLAKSRAIAALESGQQEASTRAISSDDPRLAALAHLDHDEEASTRAFDTSDPRLAALAAMAGPPQSAQDASTRAVDANDPRLAGLAAMTEPASSGAHEASTLAVSGVSDPRLAALAALGPPPPRDDAHDASTVAFGGAPDLASARDARFVPRNVERPISSGSIAARTQPAPHGVLATVHAQFRPVVVAPGWPRLGEVVSMPIVEDTLPGGVPHIAIAIDYPDHLVYLNTDDLAAWNVDFDDVFQMACSNLAREPAELLPFLTRLALDDTNIFQLGIGDYYESSRIFLPTIAEAGREVVGTDDLLIGIPNRNILLLARADLEPAELARFVGVVQYCHSSKDHPLSPHVYRRWIGGLSALSGFNA